MRVLIALLAIVATPALATPEPVAKVTVERSGANWTAEYTLLEKAPVWASAKSILPRESKQSWRIGTVRVLTPGVTLERVGNYDALVAAKGPVPERVKVAFTPFLEDIESGYDPALALSDGSVALYADQFKVVPLRSVGALRAVPADDAELPAVDQPTHMTFLDAAGPVLVHGKREARAMLTEGDAYVLFGKAKPAIGPAMTTIIDPALPQWIADYLDSELPKVLASYREQLGPSPVASRRCSCPGRARRRIGSA